MFVIVEINGIQHKVATGDVLRVDRMNELKEGDKGFSDRILLRSDGASVEVGNPYLEGGRVDYKVMEHTKGDKMHVFKKKAKKRFEKTIGHRQFYTNLEITAVK